MTKLSFEVPATIRVAMGKDSGDYLEVDTKRLAEHAQTLMPAFISAATKVILINAYNGGGKDAKQADKQAAAQKKLDAWYRGEFNVMARGDSVVSAMREAYVDDIRSKTGCSAKDVEQSIKATVASVFGEKESATFGKFIDAMATLLAKENETDKDAERDNFEAYYLALADEAAKKRTAASAKIDVTGLALAQFKKAKIDTAGKIK